MKISFIIKVKQTAIVFDIKYLNWHKEPSFE